jgi:hypothetical protein
LAFELLQVEEGHAAEVHILRGQVAHLEQELSVMTQRLGAADAARNSERCELL